MSSRCIEFREKKSLSSRWPVAALSPFPYYRRQQKANAAHVFKDR